jgi:hypothetical protein
MDAALYSLMLDAKTERKIGVVILLIRIRLRLEVRKQGRLVIGGMRGVYRDQGVVDGGIRGLVLIDFKE